MPDVPLMPTSELEQVEVIADRYLAIQVCTDLGMGDVPALTKAVNAAYPATRGMFLGYSEEPWSLVRDPAGDPTQVPCNDHPGRWHYVFDC